MLSFDEAKMFCLVFLFVDLKSWKQISWNNSAVTLVKSFQFVQKDFDNRRTYMAFLFREASHRSIWKVHFWGGKLMATPPKRYCLGKNSLLPWNIFCWKRDRYPLPLPQMPLEASRGEVTSIWYDPWFYSLISWYLKEKIKVQNEGFSSFWLRLKNIIC